MNAAAATKSKAHDSAKHAHPDWLCTKAKTGSRIFRLASVKVGTLAFISLGSSRRSSSLRTGFRGGEDFFNLECPADSMIFWLRGQP